MFKNIGLVKRVALLSLAASVCLTPAYAQNLEKFVGKALEAIVTGSGQEPVQMRSTKTTDVDFQARI